MNVPESEIMSKLRTPAPDGLLLRLRTLTPLYSGGIGQQGDQIHPSNLLGGVRHFSCLVARTLGDETFESAVWGNAGKGNQTPAAGKQVALRWDTSRLQPIHLPEKIEVPKDGQGPSRWWFNTAFKGDIDLRLTRLGISDPHWQLLRLALAIQLRHGTFGAKDQFGLGVLGLGEGETRDFCDPLDLGAKWPPSTLDESTGRLNLRRYAFFKLRLNAGLDRHAHPRPLPTMKEHKALTLGLAARATLRNALRAKPDAADDEREKWTALRHRMMGSLDQCGSAVNVSAAYPVDDKTLELRIAVALKPKDGSQRTEIRKRFGDALRQFNAVLGTFKENGNGISGYRFDKLDSEFGEKHADDRAAWLNTLAGV